MTPILIEPADTFFFRDSIPMSAGQGRGAGARLPMPSTLHEAFRSSLLDRHGRSSEHVEFRPSNAPRKGGWAGKAESVMSRGSKDFQSLQLAGPFPYLERDERRPETRAGVLFPLPLDLVFGADGTAHLLQVLAADSAIRSTPLPMLALSPVRAAKSPPSGFLSASDYGNYLKGSIGGIRTGSVIQWRELFEEEYHIGVEINPGSNSAEEGQLYAATHARPTGSFRIAAWLGLKNPVMDEAEKLDSLPCLMIGGERRRARLVRGAMDPEPRVPEAVTIPDEPGALILKWTLATSAVFAHGWLPGWCRDSSGKGRPEGEVCLPLSSGKARLAAASLGKPVAFAGWDMVKGASKPTSLAVPAGSVYYFLCENAATARELATQLHWRPRSDFYGEKGFGYGFPSLCRTSANLHSLASELFS